MALPFEFCIECGANKQDAELMLLHFSQLSFQLLTETICEFNLNLWQDGSQNWWCEMYPKNLTNSGVRTVKNAVELSEVGLRLYHRLLTAPNFRIALIGFDVGGMWSLSELRLYRDHHEDGSKWLNFRGLVLRKDIWVELDKPNSFWSRFKEGYIWQGYYGESYNPVGAADGFGEELYLLKKEITGK